MNASHHAILLIDDERDKLENLAALVETEVGPGKVGQWYPSGDEDPSETFQRMVGEGTELVVTDYDLTTAVKGLFGHSVVAWCQNRFIPVGDFSRGHRGALSTEPDLFELRVPREEADAVKYIVRMYDGFGRIRAGIEDKRVMLSDGRSAAQVLAALLGDANLESQLGPYMSKPGLFNSSLLDTLKTGATTADKTRLLTYILGHVLVNAVLKYPGPILAEGPFCAYLATSRNDIDKVSGLFDAATYKGPFDNGERLFWRDDVDAVVEHLAARLEVEDSNYESFGDYHRAVIDKALDGTLTTHECDRCNGVKGGFWCPFTKRGVCERPDCSSTASSWLPSGAFACRVERVFFDEWSPILGL